MCRLSLAAVLLACLAAVLLACLAASPARADRPTRLETAGLVAAETSLVMDALQTLDIRNHAAFNEQNPILGPSPSNGAVVGYFAGTMLATAALWYVLPSKVRYLVPIVVLALEVPQVARNASLQAIDARNHPNQNRASRGLSMRVRF